MWATARAVASSAGRARLGLGGQGVRAKHSNRAAKRFKKPQFGVSVEVRPLQFPPEEWQAKKADLPFAIQRTEKGQQLPVYIDYKNGNTRVVTQIRKYEGDETVLADEAQRVCGEAETKIFQGRIEINGHHREKVKSWLEDLGF